MFRKLALVGLVLVVGRGTVAQLSVAIILSFGFFALHLQTWPYKVKQDNLFRKSRIISCLPLCTMSLDVVVLAGVDDESIGAATELHVFIAILSALAMKYDLELETVQEGAYDWVLLFSFVVLVPVAFFATIYTKVSFVMHILSLRDIDGDARAKRRRAFDLHGELRCSLLLKSCTLDLTMFAVLGLGSDEDKADLRRYVDGWLVKKDYAAFLSHFKAEAAAEARVLKLELERGAPHFPTICMYSSCFVSSSCFV